MRVPTRKGRKPQTSALDISVAAKSSAQRLTSSLRCSAAKSPAQRWPPGLPSNSSAHCCDPAPCGWASSWCAAYSSAHAAPVAAAGRSLTCPGEDAQCCQFPKTHNRVPHQNPALRKTLITR